MAVSAPIAVAPTREERIHALDSLRAVAMFLGIVLHGACSFMINDPIAPWPVRDVNRHLGFDLTVFLIHGFRMHLFFLLAGFFGRLGHERLGTKPFIKQRALRIGLPLFCSPALFVLPLLFVAVWSFSYLENPGQMHLQRPPGAVGPPVGHAWFLQFLVIYYTLALTVARIAPRIPTAAEAWLDSVFDKVMRSPLRIVVFVPLTVLFLWNGPVWGEPHHAGAGVVPTPRAVAHYGLFFAIGWWLHRRRGLLHELQRFIVPSLVVGVLLMLVNGLILQSRPAASHAQYHTLKFASLAIAGIYAWALTFALTGAFLRIATRSSAWVRYLADSSYWCYLAHPALVVFLQVLLAEWRVPAWTKFTLLLVVTMAVLLLSYHFCVRYTVIGTILNGPRTRAPRLPGAVVVERA